MLGWSFLSVIVVSAFECSSMFAYFGSNLGVEPEQKILDDLLKRIGCSYKVNVVKTPFRGFFEYETLGSRIFSFPKLFVIPKDLNSLENKAWVYFAQLAQIHQNHTIKKVVGIMVGNWMAIEICLFFECSLFVVIGVTAIVSMVVFVILSQIFVKKSDLFACEMCTIEELYTAWHCFGELKKERLKILRDVEKKGWAGWVSRLLISDKGNFRLDLLRPDINARIHCIDLAIMHKQAQRIGVV